MVYPIVKLGDPVLEREAEEVTEFDTPDLHKFLDDMFESMYAHKGVGLAAPQIGISRKIAVIDVSNGEKPEDKLVLINPMIVKIDGKQEGEEGCLSIPGFREQVKRGRSVTIRARNARGEVFEKTAEDLLARAFRSAGGRRRLSEYPRIPGAGEAGPQRHYTGAERTGRGVREDRRRSAGARVQIGRRAKKAV